MSDKKKFVVQLKEKSPFFPLFHRGQVPLKLFPLRDCMTTRGTPIETFATPTICGDASNNAEACYWLDWSRCSAVQREALGREMFRLRGGAPSDFIFYMDSGGDLPIRVSQTVGAPFPL